MTIDVLPICFEQPLSERVRTLLRLECMFGLAHHHLLDETAAGRRAAMTGLLDILVLLSRSDLRTELLKELNERQTQLNRLQNRPGVDQERLAEVLRVLDKATESLGLVPAQAANALLKENDFLTGILNRSSIPGGSCGFDVPAYHRWLSLSAETQRRDIERWSRDMRPFHDAVVLLIKLIRDSAMPTTKHAESGVYVHTLEGPCQLIRVLLPASTPFYPEISAGKHRCTIRFMEHADINQRPAQTAQNVPFQLMLCAL